MDNENKKILLEDYYKPPQNIQKEIFDVYEKFLKWRALREQPYKQFNGKSLSDWLQESREKFWGYLPLSEEKDVPQFFFPETRNQVINILSKIANLKVKPRFDGVENFDIVTSTVLKDLFEYWSRNSNKKIKNFWNFLYTVINGTSVVFVAYRSLIRDLKTIELHDPNTGETKYKEEEVDNSEVYEMPCNLEDIYIPKIWEPDIQEQRQLIWRTLMKYGDFKLAFQDYSLVDMVVPGMQFADTSIFAPFISYNVRGGDFVEVLRYFDCEKDKYMIIANGVLLNPIGKGEKQEIAPMPWNHKKLPFAKSIFEPIDASFFYGMSLPQKVKTPQQALNKMWELMLEREVRSISSPIITTDPSVNLGLEFKPGRIYQVQADVNQYKELQIAPTSSSFWNALTSLQGIIDKTGSGGLSPIVPSVQPRSATEKAAEEMRKKETAGIYYLFYEDLLEQIAWLAIQNMIQFYTAEKTEKILGQRKFNKILSLIDIQLAEGGIGNREIRITNKPASSEELRKEAWYRSLFKKEKVEIIEISPKVLKQLKFDVKINFEEELTPSEEKAMYIDYVMTLWKLFAPYGLIDPKKVLFRLVEKFGENISDVIPDTLVQDYEMERFGISESTPQLNIGQLPEVNRVNQQMRGRNYGAAGPATREANMMPTPLTSQVPQTPASEEELTRGLEQIM